MLPTLIFLVLLLQTSAKSNNEKKCSLKGGGYYGYELSRPVDLDTGNDDDWQMSAGELIRLEIGDKPSGTLDDVPNYTKCKMLCQKTKNCIAWEGKTYLVGGPGQVGRYCALYSEIYGKLKKTRCYYASCSHAAGKCKGG